MTVFLDDGDVQLHHGDVIQTLRELPAGVAQTCVTSPPYWGLRDYGTGEWTGGDTACDHIAPAKGGPREASTLGHNRDGNGPDNAAWADSKRNHQYAIECGRCGARRVDSQLGLEATPDLYVERMVAVFREVWRVLRDDGTVWLNLGDSYANLNHAPGSTQDSSRVGGNSRDRWGNIKLNSGKIPPGLKPKDLVGIPWKVAFALQADGWYLRSDIVWSKPNPMPESVVDRPTKAHEYLFLLSKQPRYYWDADAIREPLSPSSFERWGDDPYTKRDNGGEYTRTLHPHRGYGEGNMGANPAGRNRRSVWTIPTEPFPEAHFATYPQALVRPCIQAGTSERGECSSCGAPWPREVDQEENIHPGDSGRNYVRGPAQRGLRPDGKAIGTIMRERFQAGRDRTTTGWRASCTCDAPTRPQTVLDPFIGSGTTALVARNHARRCIGIDLSAEYLAIAAKRLQQLSLLA